MEPEIVGLFEGTGALTMATQAVLGGRLIAYSEIEPAACRVLTRHHPGVPNLGDVTRIDWPSVERDPQRPLVLTGGFPCLPAGALVDAGEDGLRPIETLRVGDLVLTHERRRRAVTSVMRRQADDVLTVKAMGAPPFQVTADHPFYVRRKSLAWDTETRAYHRRWSPPGWVVAGQLDKDCFLGMPLDDAAAEPRLGAWAYVVGRWLGDGWIVDHKRTSRIPQGQRGSRVNSRVHKAIICASTDEADDLAVAITAAGLHATRSDERTAVKFHVSSVALVKALREFGRGAGGKHLPGWVFTAPERERADLLRGWLDSDGSQQESGAFRGATVSEELAHGMARLARNVHGVATSVHRTKRPARTVIEGRRVNQRDSFEVVIPPRNRESVVADGYAWVPVRSVTEAAPCEVFNVSVEGDESYIAWGYAVHNCQDVSLAGRRAGMRPETRSGLWAHMAYAIGELRPDLVIIENVRGLLSAEAHCDLEPCPWCVGDGSRPALRALGAVCGDLASLGYDAQWCGLRASDVGAPHERFRVFVIAWPAADPDDAADNRQRPRSEPRGRSEDASDPERDGWAGRDPRGTGGPQRPEEPRSETPGCCTIAPDPPGDGRHEGRPEPARLVGGPDAALSGAPAAADAAGTGRGPLVTVDVPDDGGASIRAGETEPGRRDSAAIAWGEYEPAIRRWELILGRPAPTPTRTGARGGQQLAPRFVEWLMGLPEGHVTAVPGLSRNEQLKLLGNGIVPAQAESALRHLLSIETVA